MAIDTEVMVTKMDGETAGNTLARTLHQEKPYGYL
jgi:hypothetical protein